MNAPASDPPARPRDRGYHWNTDKALAFIGALAHFGRVGEAARAVGMSRQSAYKLRARLGEGGVFAQAWDRSLADGHARRAVKRRGRKATVLPSQGDVFGLGR